MVMLPVVQVSTLVGAVILATALPAPFTMLMVLDEVQPLAPVTTTVYVPAAVTEVAAVFAPLLQL